MVSVNGSVYLYDFNHSIDLILYKCRYSVYIQSGSIFETSPKNQRDYVHAGRIILIGVQNPRNVSDSDFFRFKFGE